MLPTIIILLLLYLLSCLFVTNAVSQAMKGWQTGLILCQQGEVGDFSTGRGKERCCNCGRVGFSHKYDTETAKCLYIVNLVVILLLYIVALSHNVYCSFN